MTMSLVQWFMIPLEATSQLMMISATCMPKMAYTPPDAPTNAP